MGWNKNWNFHRAKMLGVCDYIRNTIFNKLTNGDKLSVPKGEIFNWAPFNQPRLIILSAIHIANAVVCCCFLSLLRERWYHAIRQGYFVSPIRVNLKRANCLRATKHYKFIASAMCYKRFWLRFDILNFEIVISDLGYSNFVETHSIKEIQNTRWSWFYYKKNENQRNYVFIIDRRMCSEIHLLHTHSFTRTPIQTDHCHWSVNSNL